MLCESFCLELERSLTAPHLQGGGADSQWYLRYPKLDSAAISSSYSMPLSRLFRCYTQGYTLSLFAAYVLILLYCEQSFQQSINKHLWKAVNPKECHVAQKEKPLRHRLTREPRCCSFLQKFDILSGRESRNEGRNVGDLKMGSVGSIRRVVWQDEGGRCWVVMGQEPDAPVSLTEMEVKCSFMWRQHSERGLDIKRKMEEREEAWWL